MRALLLLPFLIVPFFLPSFSAGIRLLSLGMIGVAALYWLIPVFFPSRRGSERLSPFHVVVLIGIVLLAFTIPDPWYRSVVWPAPAMGILILIILANETVPVFLGMTLTAVLLWFLIHWTPVLPNLFPLETFTRIVEQNYPSTSLLIEKDIPLPSAIMIPHDSVNSLLIFQLISLITVLSTSLSFTTTVQKIRGLTWIILLLTSLLLAPVGGRAVYPMIALTALIFSLLQPVERSSMLLFFFFFFCLIGYFGYLDFIPNLVLSSVPFLDHLLPIHPSFHFFDSLSAYGFFYDSPKLGYSFLIPLFSVGGLLLFVAETGFNRMKDDLHFPAGISLLAVTAFLLGTSLHSWLIFPSTWIAMVCIQSTRREDMIHVDSYSYFSISIGYLGLVVGLSFLITLMISFKLMPNWRVEEKLSHVDSSMDSEIKTELLRDLFRTTPFRGDIASLYATDTIQRFFKQGALPPPPEPDKLESILWLGGKYGFVSLLGYARFSSLLFLQGHVEESINLLERALTQHPSLVSLHELLGETHETLGQNDQALKEFHLCANLDPTSPRFRMKIGRLLVLLGRSDSAQEQWQQVLTLDPDQKPFHEMK